MNFSFFKINFDYRESDNFKDDQNSLAINQAELDEAIEELTNKNINVSKNEAKRSNFSKYTPKFQEPSYKKSWYLSFLIYILTN